jgi:hypothetical protein
VARRRKIATARWKGVAEQRDAYNTMAATQIEPADEELSWAIEHFRTRLLAKIDEELRTLGVDPNAEEPEPENEAEDEAEDEPAKPDITTYVASVEYKPSAPPRRVYIKPIKP